MYTIIRIITPYLLKLYAARRKKDDLDHMYLASFRNVKIVSQASKVRPATVIRLSNDFGVYTTRKAHLYTNLRDISKAVGFLARE